MNINGEVLRDAGKAPAPDARRARAGHATRKGAFSGLTILALLMLCGIAATGCESPVDCINVIPGGSASRTYVLRYNATYLGTYHEGEAHASIVGTVPDHLTVLATGGMESKGIPESWFPKIAVQVHADSSAPQGKYRVKAKWYWLDKVRYFNDLCIEVAK